MMGSSETDWLRMPAVPLEELLGDLPVEEQTWVQRELRRRERNCIQDRYPGMKNNCITGVARHAIRHYNAKHPGGEFDVVKSLTECSVRFRGTVLYHINFWARSRSSNKIKRFFAEVHYERPGSTTTVPLNQPSVEAVEDKFLAKPTASSSSVCLKGPVSVPEAVVQRARSSVCLDEPVPDAKANMVQPARSSVCFDEPVPDAKAKVQPTRSSVCLDESAPVAKAKMRCYSTGGRKVLPIPHGIAVVEVCTIIEEPLGRYRRSCGFCLGELAILHPRGSRKFVCGNDKDRMVQGFHFPKSKTTSGRRRLCPLDRMRG